MTDRYSRQVRFAPIGSAGQASIERYSVVVIGCGALGSVSAEMLVRAGFGRVRVVDRDYLEESNLQRQSLFDEADVAEGLPKAVAARRRLREINSEVAVEGVVDDLNPTTADALLSGFDTIVDGTDNFEARFLLNDWAVCEGTPWIYGAALGSYGLSFVITPGQGPCLRCIFEELPPVGSSDTCETAGILSPIVYQIAAFQVGQLLRLAVADDDSFSNPGMFQADVWEGVWRVIELPPARPDCLSCGQRQFEFLEAEGSDLETRLCGRGAIQVRARQSSIDWDGIKGRLSKFEGMVFNEHVLRVPLDGVELALFRDGRAIIKGTSDPGRARSIYSQYVGN